MPRQEPEWIHDSPHTVFTHFSIFTSLSSPLSCIFPHVSSFIQWGQSTSAIQTLNSPARQTTAVFLSGLAAMAPTTVSTTVMSKAAVSANVSADVLWNRDHANLVHNRSIWDQGLAVFCTVMQFKIGKRGMEMHWDLRLRYFYHLCSSFLIFLFVVLKLKPDGCMIFTVCKRCSVLQHCIQANR